MDGGDLTLEISDSGNGIPEHLREYIERLEVGAAPLDRRSGLGLWIVKRLAFEMNGRLIVSKTSSDGSIIQLIVPIKHKDSSRVA